LKAKSISWLLATFITFLAAIHPHVGYAQSISLIRQIPVNRPGTLSIDRLNQVYLSDNKNNLLRFSEEGRFLQSFSPPQAGKTILVEAWNMLKIFLFYDGQGQVVMLDRFLNPISQTTLQQRIDGVIRLATLAADDRFWLFNESDFSLLKFDPRLGETLIQAPLNQILHQGQYDLRYMREYQNSLYLVDFNSGIYFFDNMGSYKKKFRVQGVSFIGFRGNELYYLLDQKIYFLDLYSFKEKTIPLPPDKKYQHVLVGDKYLYLLSDKSMDIYQIR
jgi:hypothetical protein